jgi:hypothetical protein
MALIRPRTSLRAGSSSVSGSSFREHSGSGALVPSSSSLAGTGNVSSQGGGENLLFFDDFASGDMSHTENGISWGESNGSTAGISTDIAKSGQYSLRFQHIPGVYGAGLDSWSERRFHLGAQYTELWIRFYIYLLDGTEGLGAAYHHRSAGGATNNKFLRLWDDDYNNYRLKCGWSTVHATGDQSDLITEYGTNGGGVGVRGSNNAPIADWMQGFSAPRLGKWTEILAHVKCASAANNDGVMEMWIDGVKEIENTALDMYPTGGVGNYFAHGYLQGWWNSGVDEQTNVYIDEVAISNTPIQSLVAS